MIYSEWIYAYCTTVFVVFVTSCTIDARYSLEDYRNRRIECKSKDLYLYAYYSSRKIRSEYDSVYYGMNILRNIAGSIFFPYHIISYILPYVLYNIFSCDKTLPIDEKPGVKCPDIPIIEQSDPQNQCDTKSLDSNEEQILFSPGTVVF